MLQTIVIHNIYKLPITTNQANGKRWRNAAAKKETAKLIRDNAAHITPMQGPCAMTTTWIVPNAIHRDVNGMAMFAKAAEDELVALGIWPDDWWMHLRRSTLEIPRLDRENPRIIITLEELEP